MRTYIIGHRSIKKRRVLFSTIVVAAVMAVIPTTGLIAAEKDAATELAPLPALTINKAKAELGKRLFFDRRLSGNSVMSCGSCHQPEHGFSHPDALSPGYTGNGHFRNSPTLINTAHKKVWMHDGRLGTNLNDVTREMLTESYIMSVDMRLMQERLKQDPVYVQMFKDAGLGEASNGGVRKAIPEFLKTLTSKNAAFDSGNMNEAAKRGKTLFTGKANCSTCHNGALLSDGKSHNTGVPENLDIFLDPMNHQAFLAYTMFMGVNDFMSLKRDPGANVQHQKIDGSRMGKFMTPSLRELKHTSPYMHNGMLATLPDVISFYNQGGGEDSNKSSKLKPLNLSAQEQADLVEFLLSLSGDPLTGADYVWAEPYPFMYEAIADWNNVPN